jgi:hypothetical protein
MGMTIEEIKIVERKNFVRAIHESPPKAGTSRQTRRRVNVTCPYESKNHCSRERLSRINVFPNRNSDNNKMQEIRTLSWIPIRSIWG